MKSNAVFSLDAPPALRRIMLVMLVGLYPSLGCAQELADAVRAGLEIHPQVRAAMADRDRAGTGVDMARSGYHPAVSVSAGPKNFNFGEVVYDVTVSQMLYDWGRARSTVDRASAEHRMLSESLRVTRDDAALDIIETYFDLLLAERRLAAVRQYQDDLGDILRMTEARSQDGYADRSELDRARLEMTRAREQFAIEQGELQEARNHYRVLVGAEPKDLTEPAPGTLARYLANADLAHLITASPLYQRSVQGTAEAEAELEQTRAARLPQLNLEASALRREIGGRLESDSMIALRLRMDTLQGLSGFQRPTAARQRLESAQWTQDAMHREISRKLRSLFDTAEALGWREEALRQQVGESGEISTLYREQFGVGRRDIIDLFNVQRERFEAIRQLETLRIERLRIEYRAAAQIGLLDALLEKRLDDV